ncbi:hypothetical protein FRC12_009141 [Ceratobasidium sp. 428]|nr:hypothetical protein FRC12_009141 [Ceratobasidium sp. 428]
MAAQLQKPDLQRPFSRIGDSNVYVSYPPAGVCQNNRAAGKAPRVILICGWMEAKLWRLHRFTEKYHEIYPSATQILIRAHLKTLFVELPTNKLSVLPAVKLLQDAGIHAYDPPESSGLLVHAFSNGGGIYLTHLAHCLADTRPPTSYPSLPAQAIIYDSLPGKLTMNIFTTYYADLVPFAPLRLAVKAFVIAPAYAATVAYRHTIDRRPDTLTALRTHLSDPKLVPQHVPQTYIYSDIDELAQMEYVEEFIDGVKERLRSKGVGVDEVVKAEKFIGSPHILHAKHDPKRYWDAVVRTWEQSCWVEGVEDKRIRCKL